MFVAKSIIWAAHQIKVFSESKSDFLAYCYETIIFQYAIVADKAGVQPID